MSTTTYKLSWDLSQHYDLLDYYNAGDYCLLPINQSDVTTNINVIFKVRAEQAIATQSTGNFVSVLLANGAPNITVVPFSVGPIMGLGYYGLSEALQVYNYGYYVEGVSYTTTQTLDYSFDLYYNRQGTGSIDVSIAWKDLQNTTIATRSISNALSAWPESGDAPLRIGGERTKIYGSSYQLGSNPVHTLVPVRRASDHVCGLYDDGTGTFYPSANSTPGNILTYNWR